MNNSINGIIGMLQQFKANPMQFFLQKRLNVPPSMANDPNAIIQHLLNTGQITQEQINQAHMAAQRFR